MTQNVFTVFVIAQNTKNGTLVILKQTVLNSKHFVRHNLKY